jgi:hypothetical protein
LSLLCAQSLYKFVSEHRKAKIIIAPLPTTIFFIKRTYTLCAQSLYRFASERRKAKILNFSIAYGKTAYGLAKDFGTSQEEAQQTVDR